MTDPHFPPRVHLNGDRPGRTPRTPPTHVGIPTPTDVPQHRDVVGGIDLEYYPDDPSDAVLVVELTTGEVVEVPLSEIKLARLRAALDDQTEAVARARWEVAGGAPEDYVDDTLTQQPRAAAGRLNDDGDQQVDETDAEDMDDTDAEHSGLLSRARDKLRTLRDPLALDPVLHDVQKQTYKGVSVGTILLYVLIVAVVLALVFNGVVAGGWL